MSSSLRAFSADQALPMAVAVSIAIHAIAMTVLHPFSFERVLPATLTVEIAQPKQTPPPPPPEPEPVKTEPIKPQPQKRPPPKQETPPPVQEPPHTAQPTITEPPPVMAVAPVKTETPPPTVAPAPAPEKPKDPPPQVESDADLGKYSGVLAREFKKHQQYPRISRDRGQQGTVKIQLEIENGAIAASSVSESSGYEALDRQALEASRKASLFPPLPDHLRQRSFTLIVPVIYRLD